MAFLKDVINLSSDYKIKPVNALSLTHQEISIATERITHHLLHSWTLTLQELQRFLNRDRYTSVTSNCTVVYPDPQNT